MRDKLIGALYFTAFTFIATIVTTLIASILSTQRVLGSLAELSVSPAFSERIAMTVYDAQHFGTLYGLFVFIGLLAAFFIAKDLAERIPRFHVYWFLGAGMVAMFVMLKGMQWMFFKVPFVAGARDGTGLFLQMLAGGIGGLVFFWLWRRRLTAKSKP